MPIGFGHIEVTGDTKKSSFTGMMETNLHWSSKEREKGEKGKSAGRGKDLESA